MKKILVVLFIIGCFMNTTIRADSTTFVNPRKFDTEFMFGLRIPMGVARDDISSGFSVRAGIGYQLTRNWEIFHIAFDFGNSTPQDPEWVTVYDPYNYYPRLEQETVNVYGFPLTTRYRFQIQEQLEGYFSAGVAYYWFKTSLTDPYWGQLKQSRKRHGPGGLVEAGVYTDAFGENVLVGIITNLLVLNTEGKTLTTPNAEETTVDKRVSRTDYYLSLGISLRYYFNDE